MVSAAPNNSLVKARIVQSVKTKLNDNLPIKIEIVESHNIDDMINFTKERIGKTIDVFLPDADSIQLMSGDIIELKICYMGDEAGGRFVGSFLN